MAAQADIDDLLRAVDDVRAPGTAPPVRHLAGGSAGHHTRFGQYVGALRAAKREADDWWDRLIDVEAKRIGDRHNAEINVRIRRRNGAVVFPVIIQCVREAWLDCERINLRCARAARVAPEAFVLSWLQQAGEQELALFLGDLPFWPLGLDDSGAWV